MPPLGARHLAFAKDLQRTPLLEWLDRTEHRRMLLLLPRLLMFVKLLTLIPSPLLQVMKQIPATLMSSFRC